MKFREGSILLKIKLGENDIYIYNFGSKRLRNSVIKSMGWNEGWNE